MTADDRYRAALALVTADLGAYGSGIDDMDALATASAGLVHDLLADGEVLALMAVVRVARECVRLAAQTGAIPAAQLVEWMAEAIGPADEESRG